MKNRFLIFIILITFAKVNYASFPITETSSSDISNLISFQMTDEEEQEDGIKWWLLIPFVVALGSGAYFLIRAWWRAWRDKVKWVRIFTYVILGILSLMLLLGVICGTVKGGCVYNMQ